MLERQKRHPEPAEKIEWSNGGQPISLNGSLFSAVPPPSDRFVCGCEGCQAAKAGPPLPPPTGPDNGAEHIALTVYQGRQRSRHGSAADGKTQAILSGPWAELPGMVRLLVAVSHPRCFAASQKKPLRVLANTGAGSPNSAIACWMRGMPEYRFSVCPRDSIAVTNTGLRVSGCTFPQLVHRQTAIQATRVGNFQPVGIHRQPDRHPFRVDAVIPMDQRVQNGFAHSVQRIFRPVDAPPGRWINTRRDLHVVAHNPDGLFQHFRQSAFQPLAVDKSAAPVHPKDPSPFRAHGCR